MAGGPSGSGGPAVVYLGTSEFASGVLRGLAAGPYRPVLVITRPDAPKGRGRRLAPPPVAETAAELGIECEQPESVNAPEVLERIDAAGGGEKPTVVLCAYGALIAEPLLSAHEILNVHPSLLPRWRGAAPIERAIMAGDEQTGVSIMRVVEELDAGPVYAQRAVPIGPDDDYGTLAERLERLSVELLHEVITERPEPVPQSEEGVTYAEKITAADRSLDLDRPAEENARIVRALHPHIGARIRLPDGSWLGVREAAVADDGRLRLVTVQPAGGRPMPYADYLRGHDPVPGVAA
jgi:methionyl-tRNA formyltransferase